jgi:hypothetical protein
MDLEIENLKRISRKALKERQEMRMAAISEEKEAARQESKRSAIAREQERLAEEQQNERKIRRDLLWQAIIRAALKNEQSVFVGELAKSEVEFLLLLRLKHTRRVVEPIVSLYTRHSSESGIVIYLDGVDRLVHTVDGYCLKWIKWLCSDRGKSFFSMVGRNIERCASEGQAYQLFLGEPSASRPAPTAGWETYREDRDGNGPWTPYTYYVNDVCVASRGPDPRIFRLFMEILGFKCTSRKVADGVLTKVKWG